MVGGDGEPGKWIDVCVDARDSWVSDEEVVVIPCNHSLRPLAHPPPPLTTLAREFSSHTHSLTRRAVPVCSSLPPIFAAAMARRRSSHTVTRES